MYTNRKPIQSCERKKEGQTGDLEERFSECRKDKRECF